MKEVDIQKEYPHILELPLYKSIELLVLNISQIRQVSDDPSGIVYNRQDEIVLDHGSRQIKKLVGDVSIKEYFMLAQQGSKRETKKNLNHDDYNEDLTNYLVGKVVEAYVGKLDGQIKVPLLKFRKHANQDKKYYIGKIKKGYTESLYKTYREIDNKDKEFVDNALKMILGNDYKNRDEGKNKEYCRTIDRYVSESVAYKGIRQVTEL